MKQGRVLAYDELYYHKTVDVPDQFGNLTPCNMIFMLDITSVQYFLSSFVEAFDRNGVKLGMFEKKESKQIVRDKDFFDNCHFKIHRSEDYKYWTNIRGTYSLFTSTGEENVYELKIHEFTYDLKTYFLVHTFYSDGYAHEKTKIAREVARIFEPCENRSFGKTGGEEWEEYDKMMGKEPDKFHEEISSTGRNSFGRIVSPRIALTRPIPERLKEDYNRIWKKVMPKVDIWDATMSDKVNYMIKLLEQKTIKNLKR